MKLSKTSRVEARKGMAPRAAMMSYVQRGPTGKSRPEPRSGRRQRVRRARAGGRSGPMGGTRCPVLCVVRRQTDRGDARMHSTSRPTEPYWLISVRTDNFRDTSSVSLKQRMFG